MSNDFDIDDMARLLALEHIVSASLLISAGNFSRLNNITNSEAIEMFRGAIEGSLYDTADKPKEFRAAMKDHLSRIFDHVGSMAVLADSGPKQQP